jgi:two-component system, cell cycle response regulator
VSFDDDAATTQILQLDLSQTPRVLLVDDDELVLERLASLIKAAGFEVETAADGTTALELLQSRFAPVVIADLRMPTLDGLALCRAIRQKQWPGYVYILLLTAQDAEEDILAGLEAGADDYLGKRASSAQLLARLRTARRILSLEHSLKQALAEKRRLSLTDPLTGVANRRYFLKRLGLEVQQVHKTGGQLCLLCLDIDHFKQINDRHGHAAGDTVLKEFVRRINPHLGATDWCARIGGEEFVVVLGGAGTDQALQVAEAIRATVAGSPVQTSSGTIRCAVSIGVSGWRPGPPPITTEMLLQEGDQALYASKARGRNCVTLAS